MTKPKVIVILGPTAVGKTKLSIDLAKNLNGEIISADSMQIYKYMNVGTAKPLVEEMQGITHHLIDTVTPDEDFSVAQYQERAFKYIDEILSHNKIPMVVGGTGLYINSLIYNVQFSETITDEKYRAELNDTALNKGNEYLHNMLEKIDPQAAKLIHSNDIKRIIRALEVYKCTGNTISYFNSISKSIPSKYDFIIIGLNMDRQLLYQRINNRVDLMIKDGLINEVKSLLEMGYNNRNTSMQAIGYKELIQFVEGDISLESAVDKIKQESRRYAKRQITWFKKVEGIKWFDVTNKEYDTIYESVICYLNSENILPQTH